MNRRLIRASIVAVGIPLLLAAAASGERKETRVGNIVLADNGGIFPKRLPKRGTAPVTARLIGEIGTVDGSHPPAVRSVELHVDRTIGIDAVGIPVCTQKQLAATSTVAAERACGEAIVGSGKAEVEVSFPEQAPFTATGPVLLFNGGVRGATTRVFLHTYVDVPAPTAVIVPATVTRVHDGRYGLLIRAQIPKIAGGAGSVTKFELTVGRRYTYRGERKSFLVAGCPTGSWATQGQVRFADGTRLGITHIFPCTPS